jgi:hypothetical protein
MYTKPLYQELASKVNWALNATNAWRAIAEQDVENLVDCLPHGSGIDGKTTVDFDRSTAEKLVLTSSYHHMDEMGGYDGWTSFTVVVKPSLVNGIDVKVVGAFPRKYNDTREYLGEVFDQGLRQEISIEMTGQGLSREIAYRVV